MDAQVVHTPPVITVLLCLIKLLLDLTYCAVKGPVARKAQQTPLSMAADRS